MTDKNIINNRIVGGDYFRLSYIGKSNYKLNYYIDKFNFDDYWVYKASRTQKLVSYQELLEFEYSAYVFFKKELYDKKHIDMWIDYLKSIGGIQYLVKPVPPFNPYKKIIIK